MKKGGERGRPDQRRHLQNVAWLPATTREGGTGTKIQEKIRAMGREKEEGEGGEEVHHLWCHLRRRLTHRKVRRKEERVVEGEERRRNSH
ncbi:hypothetical protein U1Q18_042602 [Sarracenia purpurea var. burkii]